MKRRNLLLPVLLLLSSIAVAALGGYIKYGVLAPLGIHRDESIMAMPFVLHSDEGLQFMIEVNRQVSTQPPTEPVQTEPAATESTEAATESAPVETPVTKATTPEDTTESGAEEENSGTEVPTEAPTEAPTVPATEAPTEPPVEPLPDPIGDEWFEDMLIIGDSRIHGMRNYHRFGNAYYFTSIGMNIYNVFGTWAGDRGHYECSLDETLKTVPFGKVMIGIGLNECNYDHTYIRAGFEKLINLIHTHQPDTKIILTSVMMVTEKYSRRDECFSIENLSAINDIIYSFVDNETIFYIDMNEWGVDETGYLVAERSFDGVHFYGTYYKEWAVWLRQKFAQLPIA